jgi:AraC family transcriptional regulator
VANPSRTLCTSGGSRIQIRRYRANERHPPHAHASTTITLLVRGDLQESVGTRVQVACPMSVVVKPAGTEHADAFGPSGATTLQVTLAADDVPPCDPGRCPLGTWRWLDAPAATGALLDLLRMATAPPPRERDERDRVEDRLCDLLAGLEPSAVANVRPAPSWLEGVRSLLERGDDSIRSIAGRAGVHRVHLAHAFRAHHGMSPSEFRRRARLHRAARLVAGTARPLVEIAYDCGFADQAHMTRALAGALGETPGALRRLAGAA